FGFLALIALYALFQARFLILGPRVGVEHPLDGAVLSEPLVMVTGTASNVSLIALDGRPILIDTTGHFSEKLLLPEGPSIISVTAKDRFGRETARHIRV